MVRHARDWRPILEGGLAGQAHEAVQEIAAALRTLPPSGMPGENPTALERQLDEMSLGRGHTGYALLYHYLSEAGFGEDNGAVAAGFLDQAIDRMARAETPPALYLGFTGVAWVTALVHGDEAPDEGDDASEDIDKILRAHVRRSPWRGVYDLISGLVGLGVYALQRWPRPDARACVEAIVDRLDGLAERSPEGTTWFTPSGNLPPTARREFPAGYYNLGVAHGIPGIVPLLAGTHARGVATEKSQALLEGAVRWLLGQMLPEDAGASFASVTGPGIAPEPARSAWCYGDPGVAATLLCAADAVDSREWTHQAIGIGLKAARRPPEDTGVNDTSLCHGAAGLAHVYNRMFQTTGEEDFQKAALFWFERMLEMRQADRGIAGFTTWSGSGTAGGGMVAHPGFLTGAAGTALTLAAAVSDAEPRWDRALLLSLPTNSTNDA